MMKGFFKFVLALLTMKLALVTVIAIERTPTGLDINEPSWLSILSLIALFVPVLILAFFEQTAVRIVSAVYQGLIIFFMFFGFTVIGAIAPDEGFWIIMSGIAGAVITIASIVATIALKEREVKASDGSVAAEEHQISYPQSESGVQNKPFASLNYFSIFFAPLIGPIVIYFALKEEDVRYHAKRAIVSHVIMLSAITVVMMLSITFVISLSIKTIIVAMVIGVFFSALIWIGYMVWNLIQAIRVLS